ncbi:unnamed protein product [Brassicogethes aeneus]|uniref:Inositol-tetrakisphosphate 1-kinase n=1 Tax=Brassicogethes aeneus TaxID=1431903 RepID=A0A9P0BCT4_BRAAE|nr:unnamed protein product [Brassicogethes aeneus]
MDRKKRVAICMSEKKFKKLNFQEICKTCDEYGLEAFKLDLNLSLEEQEPFSVVLHKLTDVITASNEGDKKTCLILSKIENYIKTHPNLIVIDPLPNIQKVLNRFITYKTIYTSVSHTENIFTPNFCELVNPDIKDIKEQLRQSNITFPIICKAVPGHGSQNSHQMSIIFNESGLKDCRIPSVVQKFIKHNAILYKIFTVGDKHSFVERPSLKNYMACDLRKTIFFESTNVSKSDSKSELSILDPQEKVKNFFPNPDIFDFISKSIRQAFGMDLLGIDVIICNETGKYGIIDVNAFPGYDGFQNFNKCLIECILQKLN